MFETKQQTCLQFDEAKIPSGLVLPIVVSCVVRNGGEFSSCNRVKENEERSFLHYYVSAVVKAELKTTGLHSYPLSHFLLPA